MVNNRGSKISDLTHYRINGANYITPSSEGTLS